MVIWTISGSETVAYITLKYKVPCTVLPNITMSSIKYTDIKQNRFFGTSPVLLTTSLYTYNPDLLFIHKLSIVLKVVILISR